MRVNKSSEPMRDKGMQWDSTRFMKKRTTMGNECHLEPLVVHPRTMDRWPTMVTDSQQQSLLSEVVPPINLQS